jgi:antitoxin (DNA-binding transcriptional repressor) of toxin-antitoxin stability system
MTTISIDDVQRDPLGCLRRVEEGETLVVLRNEHAVAEIKPVVEPAADTLPHPQLDADTKQAMRLVEASGTLGFWARPEEDVYSESDGEPI